MKTKNIYLEDDPLWYKDAIIYEVHVKAFADENDDGIGDFKGLMKKLDYLEDLGITAIWLLPFYPSPLKDDGYDISEYFGVYPNYGTLGDFREFLDEAHKRGIRVITELVVNHTSDQHPWFIKSRQSKPGSVWRDFYVWSDDPQKFKDARIIFTDFESSNWEYDPVTQSYYWHRFYAHQPDLNFDNSRVRKAVLNVMDRWLRMGIDGIRLDAVPYLFEREGTNCENLKETHEFLKEMRAHVDARYKSRMFLAEANQWPEDAAEYFGNGDECHMAFHFPLMPRLFMAIWMEDRFPIIDIFEQTPPIHHSCQWALFLRNHDELTLEMVTDEERDYMYRVYATDPYAKINLGIRRRLAPLLESHRGKIEIMNILLLSLPGTPIIYYGDEIGMGDNYYLGDRDGVRTPMQWSADRNAGFSRANPQKLYLPIIIDPEYHYEAVNAENHERNRSSLLWWMRRIIHIRKRFRAFGRGSIEFLHAENPKVLAFLRQYDDENILVIINLSRFAQQIELDLSRFAGHTPEEIFGGVKFSPVGNDPYQFTLGAHSYFWFSLKKEKDTITMQDIFGQIPMLNSRKNWRDAFTKKNRERLEEEILPAYIITCRWFGGKGQKIGQIKIIDDVSMDDDRSSSQLLMLRVRYIEGEPEIYLLPVSFADGEEALKIIDAKPHAIISRLRLMNTEGVLYDSVHSEEFHKTLLWGIHKKQTFRGRHGEITAYHGKILKSLISREIYSEKSQVLKGEQSNTSIMYKNVFYLKLYRHLSEGIHPDIEITRFLTEKTSFRNIPPFAGSLEYRKPGSEPIALALLQSFVSSQGDAWGYTLDRLGEFFERVFSRKGELGERPEVPSSFTEIASQEMPLVIRELVGGAFLEMVVLLGSRTGDLHVSLSSEKRDPHFTPEPFTVLYQRGLYQSMQSLAKKNIRLLRRNISVLPEEMQGQARRIAEMEERILDRFRSLLGRKISAKKTRVHGDYHLGQILFTGNDFFIIDFEGEPARSLSERRLKRCPMSDVAGLIRSLHYAAFTVSLKQTVKPEDRTFLEGWTDAWYRYMSGLFLGSYLARAREASFLPEQDEDLELLLQAFLLEKSVYELGYELNNRPHWIIIPLTGIKYLMDIR